jgi:hypothetical protein
MNAEKIYFLVTKDIEKRPVTWLEYQFILERPKLMEKTVVIPID